MKTLLMLAYCGLFCEILVADTNIFPVLATAQVTLTNARIDRVTVFDAIIWHDGGIERISLTNLPAFLKEKYPYQPEAVEQYREEQEKKKAANNIAARKAAQAQWQAMEKLASKKQPIQIVRVEDYYGMTKCTAAVGGSRRQFLVKDLAQSVKTAAKWFAVNEGNYLHEYMTARMDGSNLGKITAQRRAANAFNEYVEQWTVFGVPTGSSYAGFEIWLVTTNNTVVPAGH